MHRNENVADCGRERLPMYNGDIGWSSVSTSNEASGRWSQAFRRAVGWPPNEPQSSLICVIIDGACRHIVKWPLLSASIVRWASGAAPQRTLNRIWLIYLPGDPRDSTVWPIDVDADRGLLQRLRQVGRVVGGAHRLRSPNSFSCTSQVSVGRLICDSYSMSLDLNCKWRRSPTNKWYLWRCDGRLTTAPAAACGEDERGRGRTRGIGGRFIVGGGWARELMPVQRPLLHSCTLVSFYQGFLICLCKISELQRWFRV